ncbi:MAG: hypothetical protein ACREQ9_15325 [Candidatus Binatia bacterium]
MSPVDTLRQRGGDPAEGERVWLRFEDERFTFAQCLRETRRYAHLFLRHRPRERPFHLGILMERLLEQFRRAGTSSRLGI